MIAIGLAWISFVLIVGAYYLTDAVKGISKSIDAYTEELKLQRTTQEKAVQLAATKYNSRSWS